MPPTPQAVPARALVLDTNIVLDLLLFQEAATLPLRSALAAGRLRWIGTTRMRDELERVLAYPQIASRLAHHGRTAHEVLALRDRDCRLEAPAPRCAVVCKDADDQCFIDLAVAHRAVLLSKDGYVLRLHKRLVLQAVDVGRTLAEVALPGQGDQMRPVRSWPRPCYRPVPRPP